MLPPTFMDNGHMTNRGIKERIEWMDLLRGISILLVIFNHAILFTNDYTHDAPDWAEVLNSVFAPLRMPLMVFLSGLLLSSSLTKPAATYWKGKARKIAYPYVVWALIFVAVDGGMDVLRGGSVPFGLLGGVLYDPPGHTWFLYYLAAFYAIAFLSKKVPPLIVAAASVAASAFASGDWERLFILLAFFMAGSWVSKNTKLFFRAITKLAVTWLSAGLAAGLVIAAVAGWDIRYQAAATPFVVAAIIVTIKLAQRVQHLPQLSFIRSIGRDSIIFYLVHWFGATLGVKVAERYLGGEPWAMVLLGAALGLIASLLIQLVCKKAPITRWLFEWKPRTVRPAKQAPTADPARLIR